MKTKDVEQTIQALQDRLTQEKDWDAIAEQQLAAIKRDMRQTLKDATVRAVHNMANEQAAKMTQKPKPHWIISTPRGNSEYYRTIYTKARAKQQDWTVAQKLMLEEQETITAAIQSSNMVVHEERMMSEEYDVVLDAMQRHRDRLWAMTEQNMRSEFTGLGIMDDIRLKQIEELDLAIKQRKEFNSENKIS